MNLAQRNYTKKELGDYTSTTFEVYYDVLNNVAIKSVLGRSDSYLAIWQREI